MSGRDIRLRHTDGVPAVARKRIVGTTGRNRRNTEPIRWIVRWPLLCRFVQVRQVVVLPAIPGILTTAKRAIDGVAKPVYIDTARR